MEEKILLFFIGICIKIFIEECCVCFVCIFDLFFMWLVELILSKLLDNFIIILFKVIYFEQVLALVDLLDIIEEKCGYVV